MTKLVIGLAAFVLLAAGGAFAGGALNGSSDDAGFTTSTTTEDTTTVGTTVEDRTTPAATREPGEDLRGPCDEAEHANDPACGGVPTGAVRHDDDDRAEDRGGREDRSGANRGSDDDDHGDDGRGEDDRSGSNSGHGGGSEDD